MFNDRFEVINNTNTTYLAHTLPWARCRGVGARIGVHPPPLIENQTFFLLYGWPFSFFLSMGGAFLVHFYTYGGAFSTM